MKATIESTDRIVEVNGVPARVWEGVTEAGVPFFACIASIAVHKDNDQAQFESELREYKQASVEASRAIPARLIL